MKTLLLGAVALIASITAAHAQQAPATTAGVQASTALSASTPIETLMASPIAKPLVLRNFPDLEKHPAYEQFKTISLRDLAPLSGGAITDEKIAAFEAELKTAK